MLWIIVGGDLPAVLFSKGKVSDEKLSNEVRSCEATGVWRNSYSEGQRLASLGYLIF